MRCPIAAGYLLLLLSACTTFDDASVDAPGGQAGASGQAGAAGQAGSSSGAGGQSGVAGQSGGGQGGSAAGGASGDAGSGGASGASGQGGAGAGGSAGEAGAGSGGEGGAGASGAGGAACPDSPPTAGPLDPFATTLSKPVTLGAAISDPEQQPLAYAWSLKTGSPDDAPTLDDPSSATPTATPKNCGTFVFSVKATDACGSSYEREVTVVVKGDGPHVSNALCAAAPELRCGTVEQPWCELDEALASGARQLKVHGSGKPYQQPVKLPDGALVRGGYDTNFDELKVNPDPVTNKTELHAIDGAEGGTVSWAAQATARLESVTVAQPAVDLNETRAPIHIPSDAHATLVRVRVVAQGGLTGPLKAAGVRVTKGEGPPGSVEVLDSFIEVPANSNLGSYGLLIEQGAAVSLTASNSTFRGGGATESAGIAALGGGSVTLNNCTLEGGLGSRSSGLLAVSAAKLSVTGGSFAGNAAAQGKSTGLLAQGVTGVSLAGGTYTGKKVGEGVPASSAGILLSGSAASQDNEGAIIKDATAEGGESGQSRMGLVLEAVPAEISGCTIRGSSKDGGLVAAGVVLRATSGEAGGPGQAFAPGSVVTLQNNIELGGGNPSSSQPGGDLEAQIGYQAYGVLVDQTAGPGLKTAILTNKMIRGCRGSCSGRGYTGEAVQSLAVAAGVRLRSGAHVIEQNEVIRGGGRATGDSTLVQHVGVYMLESISCTDPSTCPPGKGGVSAELRNNAQVAGLDSPTGGRPELACGLLAAGKVTVEGGSFLGGYGQRRAVGAVVLGGSNHLLRGARFRGGNVTSTPSAGVTSEAYGLMLSGTQQSRVSRNEIESCGLAAEGDASCQAMLSTGLYSSNNVGALIDNNYVFSVGKSDGLPLGTGNVTGCLLQHTQSSDLIERFVFNLCLGHFQAPFSWKSTTTALSLQGPQSGSAGFQIANNILMVTGNGEQRYGARDTASPSPLTGLSFSNNAFVEIADAASSSQVAYYLRKTLSGVAEYDSMTTLNEGPQKTFAMNVMRPLQPSSGASLFVGPVDGAMPTAAAFHLSPQCLLKGLGVGVEGVTDDYDGQPRAESAVEIGPDECP